MEKVKIRLKKSLITETPAVRRTVKALGFRKVNQIIEKELNPAVRGMIKKAEYMLEILS